MEILDTLLGKARGRNKTVVFPEGTDTRIIEAACSLNKGGIVKPLLVGNAEEIASIAKKGDFSLSGIETADPLLYENYAGLAELYCSNRPRVKIRVAEKLLRKNLLFGGMLLASGKADALVAGAASTTASVIQAAALTAGYEKGISTPSSFFIMFLPDGQLFFYADCALNIDPDSLQLAEIAVATAGSFQKLTGETPKVAFLSFSTRGSASHPLADKVQKAVQAAREKRPGILFDGEFQADTAISERVAKKKLKDFSPVAGSANILIFPDLNAGNIAYKLTQYLAKATALGPILQGFGKPVSDLSRGATVKDIMGVAAITSLLA